MVQDGLARKLAARREVARVREQHFEAWQYDKRLRDEITQQAEILASPMRHTFYYTVGEHGLQSDLDENLGDVLEDGCLEAEMLAESNPHWQFEAHRRRIEMEEHAEILAFARAGSPEDVIAISSMSLDQSNYKALQAVSKRLGYELPDGLGSEDILARRLWLGEPPEAMVVLSPCPDAVVKDGIDIGGYNRTRKKMLVRLVTRNAGFHDDLLDTIRNTYDASLTEQLGGNWFAGRPPMEFNNAKAFIEAQPDLLSAHMNIVQRIFATEHNYDRRMALLAGPRYNLSAALDDRLHGREVKNLQEAGAAAREEGREFKPDCPTGSFDSGQSLNAASQAEVLGYLFGPTDGIDKCVNCPFCKRLVDARRKTEKNPLTGKYTKTYTCLSSGCKIDLKTGQRIDKPMKAPQKMGGAALRKSRLTLAA